MSHKSIFNFFEGITFFVFFIYYLILTRIYFQLVVWGFKIKKSLIPGLKPISKPTVSIKLRATRYKIAYSNIYLYHIILEFYVIFFWLWLIDSEEVVEIRIKHAVGVIIYDSKSIHCKHSVETQILTAVNANLVIFVMYHATYQNERVFYNELMCTKNYQKMWF